MIKQLTEEEALSKLACREWRMSNLYYIKNKKAEKVLFTPNWAQKELMKPHYLNIILKARQLGVTTYHSILFLDTCLFNSNVNAAIIADTKPNAKEIFGDKVKFAYDNLPQWLRDYVSCDRDNVNELRFSNGSVFRVGTSLRSGTLQLLHITEFAKIVVEDSRKANEIMSGALNTVQSGQFCCIESTARGREGAFYDMCKRAMDKQIAGENLTPMDWKFWFFPWWKHPEYILPSSGVLITKEDKEYFDDLESQVGIKITDDQRAWYIKKAETQMDYMTREFPSTAEEAFTSANEGLYWGMQMAKARAERRICPVAYDENAMTYAAWDIGIGDDTALWIFQTVGNSIHFINYYENSGEILPHYVKWIKKLPYEIDKHFLPFDAASRDKSTGKTYADTARELGLKIEVLPKDKNEMYGIDAVRNAFSRIWIDNIKCAKGLKAIDAFRKEWNEKLGCYRDRSLHDWSSHASKALIYAIRALEKHQVSTGLSAEDWKKLRNTYL
jgi:hypothetical protein